jgi:glyoxylase-like metal-dependent hydrolase (beta-lactamase superfamily II)
MMTNTDNQGIRRFAVGDIETMVVADGGRDVPIPEGIVSNASMDEVRTALETAGYTKGIMPFFFNPVLVSNRGKLTLIDTGNGEAAFAQSKGAVGRLHSNLRKVDVDSAAIGSVILTHFHGDHIGGLVTADGKSAFPSAEILVPSAEYAYWMDEGNMSRASDALKPQFASVRRVFGIVGDKVRQFEDAAEVVPGVVAMATPGHTPGHTSFVVSSGKHSLVVQGDVTNLPAMFVRNPGWHARFDMDGAQAEASRRTLYDRLATEMLPVSGYHYPFPAIAHIERRGAGYEFNLLAASGVSG